ncbi:MAG: hypothetical protein OER77_18285, partial [Myxococcales bacterium]|nr:hypothetical protein [Myxococcales bacterium]
MKRQSILICAVLFALHATAEAEHEKNDTPAPPGVEAVAPKPRAVCLRDKELVVVAQQLAERQHIPPSPELIRAAREAGVDANPVYAKFGV